MLEVRQKEVFLNEQFKIRKTDIQNMSLLFFFTCGISPLTFYFFMQKCSIMVNSLK